MTVPQAGVSLEASANTGLARYYLVRAIVAAAWVAAALTVGVSNSAAAAILLVGYPAWDALANWFDANDSGGLLANPSQALNVAVSLVAAAAVIVGLQSGMNAVLAVFGVWAALAGLAQLFTGLRRWRKFGAQWAMILSGAQSTLVGVVFVKQAGGAAVPTIMDVAPYAGFGAFYFLVSALWLMFMNRKRTV
ncbi:MAG: rane protein [Tardiphaga sp.]|nr:rane protein [Tardiphaga sp.]